MAILEQEATAEQQDALDAIRTPAQDAAPGEFQRNEQGEFELVRDPRYMVSEEVASADIAQREPEQTTSPLIPQEKEVQKQPLLTGIGPPRWVTGKAVANDSAQIEVLATGDMASYNDRVALNQQDQGAFTADGRYSVENGVIAMLRDQVDEGLIVDDIGLDTLMDLPPKDRTDRLLFAAKKADLSEATHKELVALWVFRNGGGRQAFDKVEGIVSRHDIQVLETLRDSNREFQTNELRHIVNEYVAGQGWKNFGHALVDSSAQELIPVYNVFSKLAITRAMMEGMNFEGRKPWFLLGEARHQIREQLHAMSPNEKQAAAEGMIYEVKKLQSHPLYGPLIRQFGILEQFEGIFQEGILTGDNTEAGWDRFIGNLESAGEGLWSVMILGKHGIKSVRRMFNAGDGNSAAKAARVAGDRESQSNLMDALESDLAKELGVEPDEILLHRLARPEEMVDARTINLPGVKLENERLDRLEGLILRGGAGRFTRVLTEADKGRVIDKVQDELQLGDHAVVAPGMSIVAEVEDGIYVSSVLAKTGKEGWSSFDDLLPDLAHLDPNLEELKIFRRNSKGVLEEVQLTADEFARIYTTKFDQLSDADLIARSDATESSMEFLMLEREASRRAGLARSYDEVLGDEFFLQWEHTRAWHPTDKVAFGEKALRNTVLPKTLLTPNAKFGDELVGSFQENYLQGERIGRLFENMYAPFYKLGVKDKKFVIGVYEWTEDFGKAEGRAPSLFDIIAHVPDMTEKQMKGLLALRRGMDTQYEVFNRRLYLEWQSQGYKTATPMDPNAARYHGMPLGRDAVPKGTLVYDPVTQKQVKLGKDQLETIYNDGGTILQLDIAIDVPGVAGKRAKLILADGNDYKVGTLSTNPLEYYPGYQYRFYEDPYYIVKSETGVEVDGLVKAGDDVVETAVRTAGSQLEAERFLLRTMKAVTVNGKTVYKNSDGEIFEIQRGADLAQADQVLRQKQGLQREGRMFWDNRNRDRLTDVNGNQSDVMDFVKALERGTRLSARVNQEEDLMRSVKNAFVTEYGDLLDIGDFGKKPPKALLADLRAQRDNAAGNKALTKRINGAIELVKYIRMMDGVQSDAVPRFRAVVLGAAVWVDRLLNGMGLKPGKLGWVEKRIAHADPLRASRSVAFHAFMVFRPFRQALLQMSQPLFLSGIDFAYVVSGMGLKDALALRAGFWRYVDSGADAGYSNKALAKMMGLKQDEFKILLREFEKSGALDVVDVHSFAGGTSRYNKTALPKGGAASQVGYAGRVLGNAVVGTAKKVGFDFGEGMNKVGTYNVAWRRIMKKKGYKSLKEMTDADWKQVKMDTENLSLAMTRPNNAAYQQGMLSVSTQFLAFTHRVGLTMLGQNPALSGKETTKMWAAMFTLFGSNMFGARDAVQEHLMQMGFGEMLDQNIPGQTGETVIDLLSAGLIQTVVNKLMVTPIDTETFTPVLNVKQFMEMTVEGVIANPVQGMLGPFGNRASAFLDGLEFANKMTFETDLPASDKLITIGDFMMKKMLPQYSDLTMAYMGYEVGRLYHASGESIDLQPTMNAMLARGLFGARTMEEMAYYRLQDNIKDSDQIVKDMIYENRRFLKQYIMLYRNGEVSRDVFHDAARIVGYMAAMAPDGRKDEVIKGSMLSHFDDDDPAEMPMNLLTEAMMDGKLTKGEIKAKMALLVEDPQALIRINSYIDDMMDEQILNQEQLRQRMIETNPNLRD